MPICYFAAKRNSLSAIAGRGAKRPLAVLLVGLLSASSLVSGALAQDFIDPLAEMREELVNKGGGVSETARQAARDFDPNTQQGFFGDTTGVARDLLPTGAVSGRANGQFQSPRSPAQPTALGGFSGRLLGLAGLLIAALGIVLGFFLWKRQRPLNKRRKRGEATPVHQDVKSRTAKANKREKASSRKAEKPGLAATAMKAMQTVTARKAIDEDASDKQEALMLEQRANARDTDSWDQPNLDKLKSSIESDWRSERTAEPPQTEDKVETVIQKTEDLAPEDRPISDVVSNWDSWDDELGENADVWGADPEEKALQLAHDGTPGNQSAQAESDDQALSRLRALRETLQRRPAANGA